MGHTVPKAGVLEEAIDKADLEHRYTSQREVGSRDTQDGGGLCSTFLQTLPCTSSHHQPAPAQNLTHRRKLRVSHLHALVLNMSAMSYSFHLFPNSYLHQSTLASASSSTLNVLLEKFNPGVTMRLKSYGQSTPILMLKLFSRYHTTLGVVSLVIFLELLTNIISYSMSQFT